MCNLRWPHGNSGAYCASVPKVRWIWAAEGAVGNEGKCCDIQGDARFVERVLIKSGESLVWQKW